MHLPLQPSRKPNPPNIPSVSEDGYIRLLVSGLERLPLVHLVSGLDEDPPEPLPSGAIITEITGYTEWITNTIPTVTLGWDWKMEATGNPISIERMSEPRSNIMFYTTNKADMGPIGTTDLLEAFIDAFEWKKVVLGHIGLRYAK